MKEVISDGSQCTVIVLSCDFTWQTLSWQTLSYVNAKESPANMEGGSWSLPWRDSRSVFSCHSLTFCLSATGSRNSTLSFLLMLNTHAHNVPWQCLLWQTDSTLLPLTSLACLCGRFQPFLHCCGDISWGKFQSSLEWTGVFCCHQREKNEFLKISVYLWMLPEKSFFFPTQKYQMYLCSHGFNVNESWTEYKNIVIVSFPLQN